MHSMGYTIKKNEVLALIPARGGSKGVPGKNIMELGGFPLISYSIYACGMCKKINRIIVTTDSQEIAKVAVQYGAEVPFLRPGEFAGDMSADYGFVKHALDWLQINEGCVPELIVHIRPTTPLRDPAIIEKAINLMIESPDYSSLRSGHLASESPFKWFLRNEEGLFKSISEGVSNEEANSGRQKFPDVYIPDGYVDILRTSYVLESGILHGEKMFGYVSPYCTEVDTIDDFMCLEYELNNNNYMVYKKLKEGNYR